MKKVTVVFEYELKIPEEMENFSSNEIVDSLNALYDVHGKDMLNGSHNEFNSVKITHLDDKEVFLNGCPFVILDGKCIDDDFEILVGREYNLGEGADHG